MTPRHQNWRVGLPHSIAEVVSALRIGLIACFATSLQAMDLQPSVLKVWDPPEPYIIRGFSVQDGYAYVNLMNSHLGAQAASQIAILDVRDPTAPRQVSTYRARAFVESMTVSGPGNYLLVVTMPLRYEALSSVFEVVDITTPESPGVVGSVNLDLVTPERAEVVILDDTVAVVGRNRVDFTDPESPQVIAQLPISGWPTVRGSVAFVGTHLGLAVMDVSDPANPFEIARATVEEAMEGTMPSSVSVVDDLVFVRLDFLGGQGALHIFDVARPSNPKLVARHPDAGKVVASDNRLWTTASGGLALLDVSKPAALQRLGNFRHSGVQDFAVSGHNVFLACERDPSFLVLDVSRPSEPIRVGAYHIPDADGLLVAVSGHRAYLVTGRWGVMHPSLVENAKLQILDVADPSSPRHLGACDLRFTYVRQWAWQGVGIAIAGAHAFLMASDGLEIINVLDPSAPQRVAALPFVLQGNEFTREFAVSDGVAYILISSWGFQPSRVIALDVTVPGNPRQLSEIHIEEDATNATVFGSVGWLQSRSGFVPVAASGSFGYFGAYLSQQGSSLEIINLRDLDQLRPITGNTSLEGWRIRKMHANEDYLYALSGQNEGLTILNAFRETRLGLPIQRADGKIELPLVGLPYLRILVQHSINLRDWEDWQIVTLEGGSRELTDDSSPLSQRYYRAIQQPASLAGGDPP